MHWYNILANIKVLSHPAYNSFCIWTAIFWHHTAFIIKHSITIMRWVRENVSSNSALVFYIHGSVNCDSILISSNEMQQYACVYLLQISSTCFGCLSHPWSGVHKTVNAASGTGHSVRATNFRQRGLSGHAPIGQIFVKFDILLFFENMSRKFKLQ